jgi:hypothetical protein
MKTGTGRLQQVILAAFKAKPDNAFLLSELCERAYPRIKQVEKRHRVAVARAAKTIPTIAHRTRDTLGGELVFYDPLNVKSYAMARIKADNIGVSAIYKNNDTRVWWGGKTTATERELRKELQTDRYSRAIAEGGHWWRHTEIEKLRAAGRIAEADKMEAEMKAELEANFGSSQPSDKDDKQRLFDLLVEAARDKFTPEERQELARRIAE